MSGKTQTDSDIGDLSIPGFASAVNKSVKSVANLVTSGKIPSYKVGGVRRIPASFLNELRASAYGDYDAEIKRLVDAAPKLTDAQIDRLAVLLTPEGRRRAAGTD